MSPGRKLSAALGLVLGVTLRSRPGARCALVGARRPVDVGVDGRPRRSVPRRGRQALSGLEQLEPGVHELPGVNPTGPASWLTEQHVLEQEHVMATT